MRTPRQDRRRYRVEPEPLSLLAERNRLPSAQYHAVRYEALVSRGGEEADNVLDFLKVSDPGVTQPLL